MVFGNGKSERFQATVSEEVQQMHLADLEDMDEQMMFDDRDDHYGFSGGPIGFSCYDWQDYLDLSASQPMRDEMYRGDSWYDDLDW